MARSGGLLVQGSVGQRGNFEVVVPRVGGGFWHFWREDDAPTHPWHGPDTAMGSEDDVSTVVLIEDSLNPGELASLRREGNHLRCAPRGHVNVHGVIRPRWGASDELPGGAGASGAPGFIQSVGIHGNFEVVAPLAGGGLAHWWRDNGVKARPWHGPTGFGNGAFSAAALVQNDNGNLEVIGVQGSHLVHFWRDHTHTWHGPTPISGGTVSGQPGFVQAQDGTFHVVAPVAGGGLGHWTRGGDGHWSGPTAFGSGAVREVGLIQGNFGAGNFEVVARLDHGLDHYVAEPGPGSPWQGPTEAWRQPVLDPKVSGHCEVAFKPGGPSAIHVSTLASGEAFCFGFGDGGMDPDPGSFVIDPGNGHTQTPATKHHLFCSGHALLPDGRLVIMGGHGDELKAIHIFDPATVTLSHHDDMEHGRWYPTVTVLPDGRAAVMSGSQHTGPIGAKNPVNATVQVFDITKPAGHRFSPEEPTPSPFSTNFPPGHQNIDLYPWNYVLPDGRLLVHCRNSTRFWHPGTPGHWDAKVLKAKRKQSRTYPGQGTSVMLPLLPEDGYRVRIMVIGGGGVDREIFYQGGHDDDTATDTVELLDLGAARPGWKFIASMHHPRVLCDSMLLPDGKVLVVGGSSTGKSDVAVDPVFPTELYDPATDTWTELAPINCAHLYHSTALLLPDGRVMRGGKDGQFQRDPYKYFEHRLELFSPPYLFAGSRPQITSAPASVGYGQKVTVGCPTAAKITRVAAIRAGAVTHNFHMDQRYVALEISSRTAGKLTVKLPPNNKVAPPGAYMLFLVTDAGIPSKAQMIKIG